MLGMPEMKEKIREWEERYFIRKVTCDLQLLHSTAETRAHASRAASHGPLGAVNVLRYGGTIE